MIIALIDVLVAKHGHQEGSSEQLTKEVQGAQPALCAPGMYSRHQPMGYIFFTQSRQASQHHRPTNASSMSTQIDKPVPHSVVCFPCIQSQPQDVKKHIQQRKMNARALHLRSAGPRQRSHGSAALKGNLSPGNTHGTPWSILETAPSTTTLEVRS